MGDHFIFSISVEYFAPKADSNLKLETLYFKVRHSRDTLSIPKAENLSREVRTV